MKELIHILLFVFTVLANAAIAGTPCQTAVQAAEEKIKPPKTSGSDASAEKKIVPAPVNPRMYPQAASTRRWKGDAKELAALKEKIRDAIRKTEGRDIDLDALVIVSANVGDTVVGKVIYEDKGEIVVDNNPCKDEMSHFREPYVKEDAHRTVKCESKEFELFIVEQK